MAQCGLGLACIERFLIFQMFLNSRGETGSICLFPKSDVKADVKNPVEARVFYIPIVEAFASQSHWRLENDSTLDVYRSSRSRERENLALHDRARRTPKCRSVNLPTVC